VADKGESLAAKRYAQAAFELAGPDLAGWQRAIEEIAEFMGDDEVRKVLESTRIPQDPKMRLVAAALADLPAMPLNLARLLVRKSRTALAPSIAEQFRAMVQAQQGVQKAHATTAVPLTSAETEALAQRLQVSTGHPVELETDVDPDLLGGVVVQIGDRLIDASVRGKLDALRKTLV
jgi:F-type H+-transporting ATPase subunit delta